jgi:hypothetical protein
LTTPAPDSTNFIVTGGTTWPEYLAAYADLHLFPFAISGATCNNLTTPRLLFPDVLHNELGAYFNLTKNATHPVSFKPDETLYTLWIGEAFSLTCPFSRLTARMRIRHE